MMGTFKTGDLGVIGLDFIEAMIAKEVDSLKIINELLLDFFGHQDKSITDVWITW